MEKVQPKGPKVYPEPRRFPRVKVTKLQQRLRARHSGVLALPLDLFRRHFVIPSLSPHFQGSVWNQIGGELYAEKS